MLFASKRSGSVSPRITQTTNSPLARMATVTASGDGLVKGETSQTLTFNIVGTPGEKGEKFNATSCSCAFEGPSKPEIKFSSSNLTVTCEWVPKLPGNYKIYVRYEDKEITGSPFLCKVTGGEEAAAAEGEEIKCAGPALTNGRTKLTNEIIIDTRQSAIIGGLSVSMEGPAKPEINFKKNEKDGTMILTYKPDTAGQYKLHLKFADIHVPGSPFPINVN